MSSENIQAGNPSGFINDPTPTEKPWVLPSPRKVGIACLIITESALFTIFVVAYVFYMGKSLNGPFPKEVLHVPWLASFALFGSSVTIFLAEKALHHSHRTNFLIWWGVTILMGVYFVGFSFWEWYNLIYHEGLTISTNVFGTTFYSLVGLHLSHVIIGLLLLGIVWFLTLFGKIPKDHSEHVR